MAEDGSWDHGGMKWMASFVLAAGILLGGCAHREALCELPYWQVVSTDVQGCWISEYIAEGEITPTCNGYCFRAVQRRTFQPLTLTYKYPLGRFVKAQAPNIIITPACKPQWLKVMDLYTPPPNQCGPTKAFRYRCYFSRTAGMGAVGADSGR